MSSDCVGFVKLSRKMLDWQWYDDVNTKAVFLHLFLTANFAEQLWHGHVIDRGETVTSIAKLTKALGLSPRQVRTALEHLKNSGETTERKVSNIRIVKLNNYDFYQGIDKKATSDRQSLDIAPTDECQSTDNGAAVQRHQYKKEKKEKNVKKGEKEKKGETAAPFLPPSLCDIERYISEKGYHFSAERFLGYYAARGWKSHGEDIVDWRALADNWETREYEKNETQPIKQHSFSVGSLDDLMMFRD